MSATGTSTISKPVYYATWTDLQSHVRTAHPPTCSNHAEPRVFASQKGLKALMKLCDGDCDDAEDKEGRERKRKRRKEAELDED